MQRLEVITKVGRRRFTDEEKMRIVAEALGPEASVSATARRHGISPSLLFSWKKSFASVATPAAPLPAISSSEKPSDRFVLVEGSNSESRDSLVRVHFNEEMLIEFPVSMDPRCMAALLRSLRV